MPGQQAQPLPSTDHRDAGTDQQPSGDTSSQDHTPGQSRGHAAAAMTEPAAYSTVQDRTTGGASVGQQAGAGQASASSTSATSSEADLPASQALPAGTLQQVNGDEHSVRVQVHTDALGRLTADLHTRPGEMAVQLTVPDETGRALMAQRMDALRDSLGQSGTAVHLSLTAQDKGADPQQFQQSQGFHGQQASQGQQGNTPREDRAPAPSVPQPHDAVTPRATDGSSVLPAPAGVSRLVDVRA
jgi:hypothetical protein